MNAPYDLCGALSRKGGDDTGHRRRQYAPQVADQIAPVAGVTQHKAFGRSRAAPITAQRKRTPPVYRQPPGPDTPCPMRLCHSCAYSTYAISRPSLQILKGKTPQPAFIHEMTQIAQ